MITKGISTHISFVAVSKQHMPQPSNIPWPLSSADCMWCDADDDVFPCSSTDNKHVLNID